MLNIKRHETVDLARRVAERTGETLTDAVTVALRERLDRLDRSGEAEAAERIARMQAVSARFRGRMKAPFKAADIAATLYDDEGNCT